jgi:ABC-2 type transport system permease protein
MIVWKLLQVEWLKTRRRAAFWLSLLFYFSLITVFFVTMYRMQRRRPDAGSVFRLPDAWSQLAQLTAALGGVVLVVAIVLLVASEKNWRTERQNVIDGLSRDQYFLGKLLLLLALPLIVWAGTIALSSAFALITRRAGADAALFDAKSAQLLGGLFVRLVLLAAIAFCFALISTGSGPALAFVLLLLIAQQPIMQIMLDRGGFWVDIARYLPDRIMDSLTNATVYDAAQLAAWNDRLRAVAQSRGMELHALTLHAPAQAFTAAAAYIAAFTAVGWLSIRRRDL